MSSDINNVLLKIKNNKLNDAIQSLNSLITSDNKNFIAHHLRGICFLRLSKFENAKKDFMEALSLKAESPEVYNNLGFLYFVIGDNKLSIENFIKAIDLNKNFKMTILGLIKVLSHEHLTSNSKSVFISKHNEINKITIPYTKNKYIDDQTIKNFINDSNEILKNDFPSFDFNVTQIYRRTKSDLNCKRHKKVFEIYNAIPKFCFDCFKVQINVENIIDLIKLYLIFENINFKNNNTKKCLIEIRPDVKGNYKGLIYCSSIEESESIKNEMIDLMKINLNKDVVCTVKRGCTEYGMKFPEYKNLYNNIMDYNPSWETFEKTIDVNYPDLVMDKNINSSIKGVSLNDVLVIRNWLSYADIIGDDTYKSICNQKFQSNFLIKKLKLKSLDKV